MALPWSWSACGTFAVSKWPTLCQIKIAQVLLLRPRTTASLLQLNKCGITYIFPTGAEKMRFIHRGFCAEDRVPVGTRSVAENRGGYNSIFTAQGWEEIYRLPYRWNSLYCISVFDCWFFHSEYSVKHCLGKPECPWSKTFLKYLQHYARRNESFSQNHVLMLKGYLGIR